ncbi:cytochrome P450 [Macrolepiota fuliginosa MF-IS2]|uniref:Cytochrome P450 n=1 Tax=Macrolepiota fuliginosa MF-IS2 TaxID=1400762 RepID=A0A9P6C439_9AGAR|nr:cytochrome P450 [Macrolepiota fuliginosa MF-IS2]
MRQFTDTITAFDIFVLLLGGLYCYYLVHHTKKNRFRLPPGPRRYPIIGSLLSIPIVHQHKAFARLSREYSSDILYFDAAGTPIVVLNSQESTSELLERRSANYSDRPYRTMVTELIGGQQFLSLKRYGPQWKQERKLLVRHLVSQQNTEWNRRWLLQFSQRLILDIVATPNQFLDHLESGIGESLIKFIYGIKLRRPDPLVKVAHETMRIIMVATIPGWFLVDLLPWLKYIPGWVPGATFQTFARVGKDTLQRHFEKPFEIAISAIAGGTCRPSFISTYLGTKGHGERAYSEQEFVTIRNTAGMIFAGAADTTNALISNIILAMLVYPDAQQKVHREIDRFIEGGSIPVWGERSRAPYFYAVLKEVLRQARSIHPTFYVTYDTSEARWQPIVPTGIPHMATKPDVYKGYYIPTGTVVFGNAWPILNDEAIFPEPQKFKPERFLENGKIRKDVLDPEIVGSFGFGRRKCPGSAHALSTSWFATFLLLATFEITKAKDENGNEVGPEVKYDPLATICHPEPFNCTFKLRSRRALDLIEDELYSMSK